MAADGFRWAVRERASSYSARVRAHPAARAADRPDRAAAEGTGDEIDALLLLGERCAATYMRADALQYEAMVLLADFDACDGWSYTAHTSTADWLAWRIGITAGAARERVRTARALRDLPRTSAAMREGALSYAKVRALTRVARPESEEALLELAHACSAARLERKLRAWTRETPKVEARAEERRHASRGFSVFPDETGMYAVRGRLDPEVGALLMRAIEAASDALFTSGGNDRTGGGDDRTGDGDDTTPEQRRADAVGLLAERALAAGFAGGPVSGTRAERYQVVLHVSAETSGLARDDVSAEASPADGHDVSAETSSGDRDDISTETPGELGDDVSAETSVPGAAGDRRLQARLADGTRLCEESTRRLACDASVVVVKRGGGGAVLDVGRKRRTVPPALRRALEVRDGGCRYPGCGSRFTDAHHIEHWAHGGATRLENLVLLCRRHHRAVHEGRARVCRGADDSILFLRRDGRVLYDAPARGASRRMTGGGQGGAAGRQGLVVGREGLVFGREGLVVGRECPVVAREGPVAEADLRLDLPSHRTGAARWARDRDVPLRIDIAAVNAVEKAG